MDATAKRTDKLFFLFLPNGNMAKVRANRTCESNQMMCRTAITNFYSVERESAANDSERQRDNKVWNLSPVNDERRLCVKKAVHATEHTTNEIYTAQIENTHARKHDANARQLVARSIELRQSRRHNRVQSIMLSPRIPTHSSFVCAHWLTCAGNNILCFFRRLRTCIGFRLLVSSLTV